MTLDVLTVAALALVLAPVVGLVPVAYPPLLSVWTASRERHIATVALHRRAWGLLNAGFILATLGTGAGLVLLAVALAGDAVLAGSIGALAAVYLAAGSLWCAVLAIRARTTPALEDLGASRAAPEPAEVILGAATGGLFAAFAIATGITLVVLCAVLGLGGTVAPAVALIAGLIALVATGSQVVTGDTVPAILYVPTLLIGIALLAGWR